MKAGIVTEKGKIACGEWKTPEVTAGKVLIEVKACGICGSDVPRVLGDEARYYPIVIGHEFSGIVKEAGSGVTTLRPGDRVAGAPLIPCMKCDDCMSGHYALCKHYSFIGSREQGAFAQYVCIPEKNAIRFNDTVSFEQGAFFEPSTVALHGILNSGYTGGGLTAILGGGTIGLFTALWAKLFGARSVCVFDINEERLALAGKFGVDQTINTGEGHFREAVMDYTHNRGFDFVFETAGVSVTQLLAYEIASNKARVTFIGTPHSPLTFTQKIWENLNRKELLVTGTWMSYSAPFPGREWTLTAEYFSDGRLHFDRSLIHKTFTLEHIDQAFELFKNPQEVKGKILVLTT
ncbi:MAG: galactitol-1-phosphate 5-dehydrogenase [Treponema sp.]|jgi:L-iditol 2-dehydrogenase|nr:galactitol-1-phosphate 5-dehydrogenase [Treponema sp.]